MRTKPFDQFSKQFLEELLTPLGVIETSREVFGESQWVDIQTLVRSS